MVRSMDALSGEMPGSHLEKPRRHQNHDRQKNGRSAQKMPVGFIWELHRKDQGRGVFFGLLRCFFAWDDYSVFFERNTDADDPCHPGKGGGGVVKNDVGWESQVRGESKKVDRARSGGDAEEEEVVESGDGLGKGCDGVLALFQSSVVR